MIFYPNAKINIGLNVTEKRTDGYHNIETVFYPIGLSDTLSIEPSDTCTDYSLSCAGFSLEAESEDNLVLKAYRLLQAKYELPPVDISLVKRIPTAAGLGGGSSDAAFMLKGLNEIFSLEISEDHLEELAVEIGADCPVFIRNEAVYATGIGNVFAPVDLSLKNYFLLLVKPDIHVSTADAYELVQAQKTDLSLKELVKLPIREWRGKVKNDFEQSVFARYPEIEKIKNDLYNMGALFAAMSGSGSSVYGIFETAPEDLSIFDEYFVVGGELD